MSSGDDGASDRRGGRVFWNQAALSLATEPGVIRRLGHGIARTLSMGFPLSVPIGRAPSNDTRPAAVAPSICTLSCQLASMHSVGPAVHAKLHSAITIPCDWHGGPVSATPGYGNRPRAASQISNRIALARLASISGQDAMNTDSTSLAVPVGSSEDPLLMVEYCTSWLPPDLARLPELDLGDGLARAMHCYAHGGFMGAAISMLADPEWRHILIDSIKKTSSAAIASKASQLDDCLSVYHLGLQCVGALPFCILPPSFARAPKPGLACATDPISFYVRLRAFKKS